VFSNDQNVQGDFAIWNAVLHGDTLLHLIFLPFYLTLSLTASHILLLRHGRHLLIDIERAAPDCSSLLDMPLFHNYSGWGSLKNPNVIDDAICL
jgi:hypothetical protein